MNYTKTLLAMALSTAFINAHAEDKVWISSCAAEFIG